MDRVNGDPRIAGACILVALAAGCGGQASEKGKADEASKAATVHEENRIRVPESSPVRKALVIAPVAEESVERPIAAPAVVEADPARLMKVVPPFAGRIVHLHKRLGDTVKAGDALFTLESADFAQAASDASKTQAALALSKRNLERQKELAAAEIAARKDLEQAESDYAQASAEAARARARLVHLGEAREGEVGRQYTLRSPIAGHVVDLTGAQGAFWNDTNAAIMTVADLSTVWITASIQEKDIGSVFVGQGAQIALNAYQGESSEGKVQQVGQMLDPDTRTIKVRIAIDNRGGRLRPGMFGRATFRGRAHPAIVVPANALVQSGFNARVYVERSPWVFEPRVVRTGAQIGDRVEILDGLKAGERIVTKDGVLLND